MKLLTLDFETYYGDDYTLSKLTTEAYVRDPRFEEIMVGIKVDDGKTYTVVGKDIDPALKDLDIGNNAVLCHHSHFDGLILSHHHGLKPKIWFDTLPMGRAEVGSLSARGISLGALRKHFGMADKGEEVVLARGKHLADFTAEELKNYRRYCGEDVDGTYDIFNLLRPAFATSELKLIDLTTRLFTEPILMLDTALLEEYRDQVLKNKEFLMLRAGVSREELMSGPKFADVLRRFGVEPEMKDSPTAKMPDGSPKQTYAFAKTDDAMKRLLEHEDEFIQILAEARLGVKTTIAETRAKRFIDMSLNGEACVYLKYWGAEQTGRHAGGDSMNWQNLGRSQALEEHHQIPSAHLMTPEGYATIVDPGAFGLTKLETTAGQFWPGKCHRIGLRDTVYAPEGHVLVVGDSSNIEARMVCWIAGQEDILDKYRNGEDLYCDMAASTYGYPVTKANKIERQLGKVAVLGLGFGMGKKKFFDTATGSQWRVPVERDVTDRGVEVFRARYNKLPEFWRYLNDYVIPAMADGKTIYADPRQLITTLKDGLRLPNGRILRYPNLRQRKNPDPESPFPVEWVFDVREGGRIIPTRLYGGKLCVDGDTQVLTNLGWVLLKDITVEHQVHDGVDFVSHGGIINKGVQNCIEVDGVLMTPEHEVLTDEGWKTALEKPRPYRPDLRDVGSIEAIQKRRQENVMAIPVPMRVGNYQSGYGRDQRNKAGWFAKLRMCKSKVDERENDAAWNVEAPSLRGVAQYVTAVFTTFASRVEKLWRAWNNNLSGVGGEVRELLVRYAVWLSNRAYLGTPEQRRRILEGQLLLGDSSRPSYEQTRYCSGSGYSSTCTGNGDKQVNAVLPTGTQPTARTVYDILNCGPRHRFVVRGRDAPFIVHNCENIVQALARIVVLDQAVEISRQYKVAMMVHDEAACCVPEAVAEECEQLMMRVMSTTPSWCAGLPLGVEVGIHKIYSLAK